MPPETLVTVHPRHNGPLQYTGQPSKVYYCKHRDAAYNGHIRQAGLV